jgi:hypothetical protein
MNGHLVTCLVVFGLASAACAANASNVSSQRHSDIRHLGTPGNENAATETRIPWQLTPASTASRAQGEKTFVKYVSRVGRVRGTVVALGYVSTPMTAYPGPHGLVQPCRRVILPQATRIGAYSVEAAAAGPERSLRHGTKRQQVFFRIFYRHKGTIEVRQAALMCTLNARGTVTAANPV